MLTESGHYYRYGICGSDRLRNLHAISYLLIPSGPLPVGFGQFSCQRWVIGAPTIV